MILVGGRRVARATVRPIQAVGWNLVGSSLKERSKTTARTSTNTSLGTPITGQTAPNKRGNGSIHPWGNSATQANKAATSESSLIAP